MKRKVNERLVQTVVSKGLAEWVRASAAADGVSSAAWVRRLLLQAQSTQASTGEEWRIGRLEDHEKNMERELTRLGREHTELLRALAAFGLARDFDTAP